MGCNDNEVVSRPASNHRVQCAFYYAKVVTKQHISMTWFAKKL